MMRVMGTGLGTHVCPEVILEGFGGSGVLLLHGQRIHTCKHSLVGVEVDTVIGKLPLGGYSGIAPPVVRVLPVHPLVQRHQDP